MFSAIKKIRGKKAYAAGLVGEMLAIAWLSLKGYQFIGWRQKTLFGEVDLVMLDPRAHCLVLVEVKNHQTLERSQTAISFEQQRRLKAAANVIAARVQKKYDNVRFDAVFCGGWAFPVHLKNAFF